MFNIRVLENKNWRHPSYDVIIWRIINFFMDKMDHYFTSCVTAYKLLTLINKNPISVVLISVVCNKSRQ